MSPSAKLTAITQTPDSLLQAPLTRIQSAPELCLHRQEANCTSNATISPPPYNDQISSLNYGSFVNPGQALACAPHRDVGHLELQAPIRLAPNKLGIHPGIYVPVLHATVTSLAVATVSAVGFYFFTIPTKDQNSRAYGDYIPGPRFLLGACGGLIGAAAAINNCGDRNIMRIEARAKIAVALALLGSNLGLAASTISEYIEESKTHDFMCSECLVAANPSVVAVALGTLMCIMAITL